jgi:hypothetical protein
MPDFVREVESGTQRKDAAHRLSNEVHRAIDAVDDEPIKVVEAVYIIAANVRANARPSEEDRVSWVFKAVRQRFPERRVATGSREEQKSLS